IRTAVVPGPAPSTGSEPSLPPPALPGDEEQAAIPTARPAMTPSSTGRMSALSVTASVKHFPVAPEHAEEDPVTSTDQLRARSGHFGPMPVFDDGKPAQCALLDGDLHT